MKKFKITFLAIASAFMMSSCTDDFLEKVPPDTINTSNYPKTADELITMVNGAYQPLQWPKLYNMRMWTTDIFAGNSEVGAGGGSDGIETTQLANFVTSSDNAGVLDLWRGPWPGILSSNIVLKEGTKLNIDQDIKNRCMGEAYFLRAHYYFLLVRFFGDVPLITEPQDIQGDLYPARAPKEDVYKQIISDLEQAIELLPTKQQLAEIDNGRATKGAAMGTLAKVYLTRGEWQKVVDLTAQLDTMGYTLNADYSDNFNPDKENGVESLFEVQYSGSDKYDFWSNENQSSWTSAFMGPRGANFVAGGWGWNQPTQEFVDSYEAGDQRKAKTIFYEGCPTFDGKEYKPSYSMTGYNVRKFLVPFSAYPDYNKSPLNFPILRYADVLLMRAEALNELGQTSLAAVPLNKVRNRAGLAAVSGSLSQSAFREKVLHERRMELAFEGQRWFDLIRVQDGQYGLNFLHSIGKTNAAAKHLLLPVPQIERDRNPNLTQNPGY